MYRCSSHFKTCVSISGWWFGCHQFYVPRNIGFLIIPIDELIFFRGVAQPPTRVYSNPLKDRTVVDRYLKKGEFDLAIFLRMTIVYNSILWYTVVMYDGSWVCLFGCFSMFGGSLRPKFLPNMAYILEDFRLPIFRKVIYSGLFENRVPRITWFTAWWKWCADDFCVECVPSCCRSLALYSTQWDSVWPIWPIWPSPTLSGLLPTPSRPFSAAFGPHLRNGKRQELSELCGSATWREFAWIVGIATGRKQSDC